MLVDVRIVAAGGRRRRVGFYSAIRREVPIRTFNDWNDPPPGFFEIDMVAHGGTSVAGSFSRSGSAARERQCQDTIPTERDIPRLAAGAILQDCRRLHHGPVRSM